MEVLVPIELALPVSLDRLRHTWYPVVLDDADQPTCTLFVYVPSVADTPVGGSGTVPIVKFVEDGAHENPAEFVA